MKRRSTSSLGAPVGRCADLWAILGCPFQSPERASTESVLLTKGSAKVLLGTIKGFSVQSLEEDKLDGVSIGAYNVPKNLSSRRPPSRQLTNTGVNLSFNLPYAI